MYEPIRHFECYSYINDDLPCLNQEDPYTADTPAILSNSDQTPFARFDSD